MADLIHSFGVELQVYRKTGDWVNGRFTETLSEPEVVSEVLVPLGRIGEYSQMFQLRDLGAVEQYQAMWLSLGDYPDGTIVEHGDDKMLVMGRDNYRDYSDVAIYYLNAYEDEMGAAVSV
ncbi:hypothetical protein [Lacticaseibacillus saniviri]